MLCKRCQKNPAVIFVSKIEGNNMPTPEGLCLQCARELGIAPIDNIINQMGISEEELESSMEELSEMQSEDEENSPMNFLKDMFAKSGFAEQKTKPKDDNPKRKFLDMYGINLTERARKGEIDPVIGRDKETSRVIQILNRRTKNNPILLGEPGVGKTAIAEGLALKIIDGKVPAKLLNCEVYLIDFAALVAGTQFRGQFESRLKNLINEVISLGNIILVIDEVHNIVGAGSSEGAMNAANILKPSLARGELQVIGATTMPEYRKHIEKDSALERRFQSVMVDEPTAQQAIEMIKGIKNHYEQHHYVIISDYVIESCVLLSQRYIHDRFLPDKAIDILDECSSRANLNNSKLIDLKHLEEKIKKLDVEKAQVMQESTEQSFERSAEITTEKYKVQKQIDELRPLCFIPITTDDVTQVIESWTKIPVNRISHDDREKLLNLDNLLHQRVIGQDSAIETVTRACRRKRVSQSVKKRPVSFIFVGPTGVGKTELAKALAQVMFGDEKNLIRLDMSEYMDKHTTSKMIGSPPGYVGYDDGGGLSEKVRRNPYSVILLDEIEKAHSEVANVLLQILDDGILTDNHGKVVHFENTIIIMTSNAGSENNNNSLGFGELTGNNSKYIKKLKELFRPEFLNRIDEIVEFDSLTYENIMDILTLNLSALSKNYQSEGIFITFSTKAKEFLIGENYNYAYGARPLARSISTNIEDQIAMLILQDKLPFGTKLKIDCKNNKLDFVIE